MDINKIFGSFTSEDDNIVAIDFSEHPTYLLGMFKKLILNHKNFFIKNLTFLLKSDQGIDRANQFTSNAWCQPSQVAGVQRGSNNR